MYYHKITEYEIKCCMHAHHVPPRAPSSRGELYRRKTLFLDDFPIFFYYPNGTWTHPPTSKLFLDFWNYFNFAKPLSQLQFKTNRAYVQERSSARMTCPVVVVDKIMLGAWPKMPTSTYSQSRGRISSQQKFSVVDL